MEQRKTEHYEIQFEKSHGEWAELLQDRPKTEEEIPELRDRAQTAYPGKKIRAVRVTTTVTLEEVFTRSMRENYPHKVPVTELLQDCD